jgi:hypothetical protein
MAEQARDWRADLVTTYADLFHPVGDPPSAEGWPSVGDGWHDLLDRACAMIQSAIRIHGGSLRAAQVKEKFGSLRFYWQGALSPEADTLVEEAIALAEARSATTCEACGEEGRLYRAGGVLLTRCAAHAEGRIIESKSGFDNLLLTRKIVGGRLWTVAYRRYVRGTDSFVDVDPASLGIEEE